MKKDNLICKENNLTYNIRYRNIKNPRLEFKTGKLVAIVPFGYDTNILIAKYRKWIIKKASFIEDCQKESIKKEISNRSNNEFVTLVTDIIRKLTNATDGKIDRINFRKMKSRWASIRLKKNTHNNSILSFNKQMKYLPDYLIEYISFHEITHLKEKKHNKKFWEIIKNRYKNFKELESELFVYWFKISSFCVIYFFLL